MTVYRVLTCRWNDPTIAGEVPARGLSFNLPLSDSGQVSCTASVGVDRRWRDTLAVPLSGLLVTRDDQPVHSSWLTGDTQQPGSREFSLAGDEWLAFYGKVPAVPWTYTDTNDHVIFRDVLSRAAAVSGQSVRIVMDSTTTGAATSDLTLNAWDHPYVLDTLTDTANADGGPEWAVVADGSWQQHTRRLLLADTLGLPKGPDAPVIEYVEPLTGAAASAVPQVGLLGQLFPTGTVVQGISDRRGGNAIAVGRTIDAGKSATVSLAVGAGDEKAQLTAGFPASALLANGWPRLTQINSYTDVSVQATLNRHATADLAASAGRVTTYQVVTLDGAPDWTGIPRGSWVRLVLDTDLYGKGGVDTWCRVQDIAVNVDDDGGPAQVTWTLSSVLEV